MKRIKPFQKYFPFLVWGKAYDQTVLVSDLLAALIVTVMLIPQSLAYAMLAGLSPEIGLYASIAPLVVYAILGSSRVLAVGPVAVVSLMTAAALGQLAQLSAPNYWAAAMALACLSGLILLLMGLLRLGVCATFLSHPVISGFISASGLLVACSQLKTLFGIKAQGHNLIELLRSLYGQIIHFQPLVLSMGLTVVVFLMWARRSLKPNLLKLGCSQLWADLLAKAGPVLAIVVSTALTYAMDWQAAGVSIVGTVPQGLPSFSLPLWDAQLWQSLLLPALLISIVGFVESVSVGQTLAAKSRQRIDPNQELLALGGCNLAAAFTGGFPVTGGFSRSVVNFDAGAKTPAAGIYTAIGIAVVALFLTPTLYYLPQVTLAATIIVAVLSLVDLGILKRTWAYDKTDFIAVTATMVATLASGVEIGLVVGISVSIILYLRRTSRPHIAQIGLVPGTEHFRNIDRHDVQTLPDVIGIRVDEGLYFANARVLEDYVNDTVARHGHLKHLVLQCAAVNHIDASALESLEAIAHRLEASGIKLHLSEVKGPVMDKLSQTHFIRDLNGSVFLTHYQAIQAIQALSSQATHLSKG